MRLLLIVPFYFSLLSCQSEFLEVEWRQEVAAETGLKLGGCVVGEFNPDNDGADIAVVAVDGSVFVMTRDGETWKKETAAKLTGEMIQCTAGEIDASHKGDEIIVCGMLEGGEDDGGRGAAYCLRHKDGSFTTEKILEDDQLFHAVCVADLDSSDPGPEILLAGYTKKAHIMAYNTGQWEKLAEVDLPGRAKGACEGRGGAIVACAEGQLVTIVKKGDNYTVTELFTSENPLARVTCNDGTIAVCDNGGAFHVLPSGESKPTTYAVDKDRLRGAIIADLHPNQDGLEWATAGYNGQIMIVLPGTAEKPEIKIIGKDDDKFHHLAFGDLPGLGKSLVGCGYSGRVIVCSVK